MKKHSKILRYYEVIVIILVLVVVVVVVVVPSTSTSYLVVVILVINLRYASWVKMYFTISRLVLTKRR